MEILFITGIALVAREGTATRDLLIGTFGLPLESMGGAYFASDKIEGAKHFGVWPLEQAAEACFGTKEWPRDRPIPQLSIELEVRDAAAVSAAEKELRAKGLELLHGARKEPWGQTVCRMLTAEGVILGVSYAPSLHT